jgi:hypothetical protein
MANYCVDFIGGAEAFVGFVDGEWDFIIIVASDPRMS